MRRFLPLIVMATIGLAACGSSKPTAAKVTTSTTAASSGGQPTVVPDGSTGSTTAPTFTGSSSSQYCQVAKDIEDTSKLDTDTDLKTNFAQFDGQARSFLKAAPSQIKADAQTVVNGLKQYEAKLKQVNFDTSKLSQSDLQAFEDPRFEEAASRIDAYNEQVCGIKASS